MIDWATIKDTVKSLIQDLAKPCAVKWADEAEGSGWIGDPVIFLRLNFADSVGIDEERRENVETENGDITDDDQIVTVVSQKRFTLGLRCESFDQNIAGKNGGTILEGLRTKLGRSSSIERMAGIFGISDDTAAKWIGYTDRDDRKLSTYVMDLFCLTVDNDIDDTEDAGSYMEEIIITGTVQDGARTIPVNLDVKGD